MFNLFRLYSNGNVFSMSDPVWCSLLGCMHFLFGININDSSDKINKNTLKESGGGGSVTDSRVLPWRGREGRARITDR